MELDINSILKTIPHRYPILLVDRVLKIKVGESIVGLKNVTFNEPHFLGHFPSRPIMPGVLIIEALAQLSALLAAKTEKFDKPEEAEIYFMSIESAKFRKIVAPGDTMYLYSKLEARRSSVWKFEAYAEVNDRLAAEAKLTAMVKRS